VCDAVSELAAITGLTFKNTSGSLRSSASGGGSSCSVKLLRLTVDGAEVVRLLKEHGLHALIELLAALGSATAPPPR
jgi:hypothetical protein